MTQSNKKLIDLVVEKKPAQLFKAFEEELNSRISDKDLSGLYEESLKELFGESVELSEVEAPSTYWNLGMSQENPIAVSQKQPASPGQYKATHEKSPARLADKEDALQGKPRETRKETEDAATSRKPRTLELSADWHADIPSHSFDHDLDSQTEFYPLFSMFNGLGPTISKANEEELNEVSKKTLGSYINKAVNSAAINANIAGGSTGLRKSDPASGKHFNKAVKRIKGVEKAVKKLSEDGEVTDDSFLEEGRSDSSSDLMAKATKDEKKAAKKDEKDPKAFDKIHAKHESEVKKTMEKLGEEELTEAVRVLRKGTPEWHEHRIAKDTVKNPSKALLGGPSVDEAKRTLKDKFGYTDEHIKKLEEEIQLDEVSKDTLSSYLKKAKPQHVGLKTSLKNDFGKMKNAKDWSPNSEATKAAERTNSIKHKYHTRDKGISTATKKLEEGEFKPENHSLIDLWDEHARRSGAQGSGSRKEILQRIEEHVAKKHGEEGLRKMRLHSDLCRLAAKNNPEDKHHLSTLVENMRKRCAAHS